MRSVPNGSPRAFRAEAVENRPRDEAGPDLDWNRDRLLRYKCTDGDSESEWKHHPNQYIYIGVSDLDSAVQRARDLGAKIVSDGIQAMPWGERLFYARDPFENPICLVDGNTLFLGAGE